MHELSLVMDLVERAVAVASKEKVQSVKALYVRVGPDAGIDPAALSFAFPVAITGTLLQGAELIIESGKEREFTFASMEVEGV
jgi:hydrogenase nickel incorporation protein HypA/HybF